jgi:hypothetical protein
MMKPWRCYQCNRPKGLQFLAEEPKCPSCGAFGKRKVVPLVFTHWFMPDPEGPLFYQGGERYRLACMPKRANLAQGKRVSATGAVQSVTCPICVQTPEFLIAKREQAELFGYTEQEFHQRYPATVRGLVLRR